MQDLDWGHVRQGRVSRRKSEKILETWPVYGPHGKGLVAVSVGQSGINLEYFSMPQYIRTQKHLFDGSIGGVISGRNMNKAFSLPPRFAMMEMANNPNEAVTLAGIDRRTAAYADSMNQEFC